MTDTMTGPVHVLMNETHSIGVTLLYLQETLDPDVTSSLLLLPCLHVAHVIPWVSEEVPLILLIGQQTICSVDDLLHHLLTGLGE